MSIEILNFLKYFFICHKIIPLPENCSASFPAPPFFSPLFQKKETAGVSTCGNKDLK
jgi:hypothetical protein